METILDEIPNAQRQSISPSKIESTSPSTIESISPSTIESNANNTTPAAVENAVSAVASTPTNPIQQQLDHHALMKQVSILNKQLALLRANQVSNPQAAPTLPFENVTNILQTASSLLPQTSTTTSSNKENAPKAPSTGAKRGPKPLPRDPVTGAIIRPRDEEGNVIVKTRKSKNK
jgi:hypothetical protein